MGRGSGDTICQMWLMMRIGIDSGCYVTLSLDIVLGIYQGLFLDILVG